MLSRITTWLFMASLVVMPVTTFLYITGFATWMIYPAIAAIIILLAGTAYGLATAYKTLAAPAQTTEPPTPETTPDRKWHLFSLRFTVASVAFAMLVFIVGLFGTSFVPFIVGFISLFSGLFVAMASATGVFEKMDKKRHKKRYPKPAPVPPPPLPKKPKPEDLAGYQYSFDF